MKIAAFCQRHIAVIDRTSAVVDAATLMRKRHVGALVLTSATPDGLRMAAITADRDLVIRALASGLDAAVIDIGERAMTATAADTAPPLLRVPAVGTAGWRNAA